MEGFESVKKNWFASGFVRVFSANV